MYLLDVPLFIAEFTKSHRIQQCLSKFDIFQYCLMANVNLSEDVQLFFFSNSCWKYNLASNPSISVNTQLVLIENGDVNIIQILANNTAISREAQLILVECENWNVKILLLDNPSLCDDIREMMK